MDKFKLKASADDLDLACLVSEPATEPLGLIQIVHGMCEHKERYIPFMQYLSANGYVCIIHDNRGHGESVKSPSDLGYMYAGGWKALVNDIKEVFDWSCLHYPGLSHSLLGHSMGSMAVRSFAKHYDCLIDRLFIVGCPSDNPAKVAGKMLADTIGFICGGHCRPKILQKMSFGAYNKPFAAEGFPAAWVCSDKKVLEAYHSDPLCQFCFTANGFSSLLGLMKDCYSADGWKPGNPDIPIHFLSGGEDPCRISDDALRQAADFMRRVGYTNVGTVIYPGMRHEILNETRKEEVWKDILDLLNQYDD